MHKQPVACYRCFISLLPILWISTCQAVFMQCQTATLNSFRSILMDAQSQGLSLHPLDQQSWLGNVAICSFISVLFSLHPNISLSPLKLLVQLFLISLWHPMSLGLRLPFTAFLHLSNYLWMFFSLVWFFFNARRLIKQLLKSKVWLSVLPFASFLSFYVISFSLFVCSARWLCVQRLREAPNTESVGVREQERENERVCLRASLYLSASVCH